MKTAAIVVAAGSSSRMGFDKLTAPLLGRPLAIWSLVAFENCPDIDTAVLVCAPDRIAEFSLMAEPFSKFRHVIAGGLERSESVVNGLQALAGDPPLLAAVHDAARPLITPALISLVLKAAHEHEAASAAHPVTDSLHRADSTGALFDTIPRQNLFAMETPQAARFDLLLAALRSHRHGATDEVSALISHGIHPIPVIHTGWNLKVTHPRDLETASFILSLRQ